MKKHSLITPSRQWASSPSASFTLLCRVVWVVATFCLVFTGGVNADVVVPAERVKTQLNVRDLNSDTIIGHLAKGESVTYIDSIPHYYVIELPNGTRGRVSKSWSEHIEGSTSSILRIATFNIKDFGPTKAGKPDVMAELASIVRAYDVVAIQEISDIHETVPGLFLDAINSDGAQYAFLLSERGGQQPDDQSSQEQYAFYYNTQTVKALDDGALFDDSAQDLFQREPFIARFGSVKGGLTFVLVTIHTRPEAAVQEIKALHTVIEQARDHYVGEDDFVALGDFNGGCDYASPGNFAGTPIQTNYQWVVPDTADTNVSTSSACPYDRILISSGMIGDYTGKWGIDTVSSKMVSDHFPVWGDFKAGFHN